MGTGADRTETILNKTVVALLATAILAFGTVQVFAMTLPPPPPPCANCGGQPDPQPDPGPCEECEPPPPGGSGNPGLPPPPDKHDEASTASDVCNAGLGKLRKVTEAQVEAYDNEDGVRIVPVCERNATLIKLAQIDPSQALPVRDEIAGNSALVDPLQARGYNAEDVVGVIIGENGATLYVHRGA